MLVKENYVSRFRSLYFDKLKDDFKKNHSIENDINVPEILKIVVNTSYGPAVTDKKKLNKIMDQFSLIVGQRPVLTKAKRSLAGFHLREGMPLGMKVTLRKNNMYDFLDKLINIAMPRIKDFRGYSDTNFDHDANFNFGITDQTVFPEIDYDNIDFIWGMNITIVTSTKDVLFAKDLLTKFNFPFKK